MKISLIITLLHHIYIVAVSLVWRTTSFLVGGSTIPFILHEYDEKLKLNIFIAVRKSVEVKLLTSTFILSFGRDCYFINQIPHVQVHLHCFIQISTC